MESNQVYVHCILTGLVKILNLKAEPTLGALNHGSTAGKPVQRNKAYYSIPIQ